MEINLKDDLRLVQNARRNAYVKNEEITVGAVLQTKSGRKYTGCNIQISDLEIIEAEQVAITKAISEGEKEFDYIVLSGGKKSQEPTKYQISQKSLFLMKNLVDEDFKIYVIYENRVEEYKISDLIKE